MPCLGLGPSLGRKGPAVAGLSEYLTNGAFASDTNWTKGTGWTISGGQAVYAGGAGGEELSQNFGALTQALTNGASYRLSFDLLTAITVNVVMSGGTGTQSTNLSGAGAKTWDFTASDARTTVIFRNVDGDPFTIDNASLAPA